MASIPRFLPRQPLTSPVALLSPHPSTGSSCADAAAQGTTGASSAPYATDAGGTGRASFAMSSTGSPSTFGMYATNKGKVVVLFDGTVPANNAEPPYRVACGVLAPVSFPRLSLPSF